MLLAVGYYGEMLPHNSGRTVVVKSHGLRADMFDRCHGKAILLIRNPYKALISYWELTQTQDHTGSRGIDQYVSSSSSFDRHVKTGAARWLELILDWAEHCIDCHLVFFEVNIMQIPRYCQNIYPFVGSEEELRRGN